ncbi:MAG: sulfatase-like hydrolase/transferase, partial [Chloroflexota bacterium]|nr:sulfatase-like hydrolase/transferase [Chloroflexota bacterium]
MKKLRSNDRASKNVLILVFDAWSAANMSLYGYQRETTPKLERLAEKAVVYHNHYAGSHYTTPGTASLLTGTTPWTHHAFDVNATVEEYLAQKSIFHAFPRHHRLAYSHNAFADTLLRQFIAALDAYTPWERLYFENDAVFTSTVRNDLDIAAISKNRALRQQNDGFSYSLFLSRLYEAYKMKRMTRIAANFPRGVP